MSEDRAGDEDREHERVGPAQEQRTENEWDAAAYDDDLSVVYELADDLVDLLDPEPGERVLDAGCGTGHLTAAIAERGADVLGVDRSREMVARARSEHPELPFLRADLRALPVEASLDAVFSNAALHWVEDHDALLASIRDALRPGGRLVAELGGAGNVAAITDAVADEMEARGYEGAHPWHFPSPGELAARLEDHGFEVRLARLFDRPTPLDGGEEGLATWLEVFGDGLFATLAAPEREDVVEAVEERLREGLWNGDRWVADYRRLRVVAVRL